MRLNQQLKSATHEIHMQLHVHPMLEVLTSASITAEQLLSVQQAQYGFWQPLQSVMSESLPTSPVVAWLEQDLRAAGISPAQLPVCQDLPPIRSEADRLGVNYVKEGSLLGGQVIYKNISQALPEQQHALRFFQGHGKQTGLHWRAVLADLEQRSQALSHDAICQSALSTFTCFKRWMDQCSQAQLSQRSA